MHTCWSVTRYLSHEKLCTQQGQKDDKPTDKRLAFELGTNEKEGRQIKKVGRKREKNKTTRTDMHNRKAK